MIDNSKLTPFLKTHLRDMPYQNMVEAYDSNCAFCPFKKIQLRKNGKLLRREFISCNRRCVITKCCNNSCLWIWRRILYIIRNNFKHL